MVGAGSFSPLKNHDDEPVLIGKSTSPASASLSQSSNALAIAPTVFGRASTAAWGTPTTGSNLSPPRRDQLDVGQAAAVHAPLLPRADGPRDRGDRRAPDGDGDGVAGRRRLALELAAVRRRDHDLRDLVVAVEQLLGLPHAGG